MARKNYKTLEEEKNVHIIRTSNKNIDEMISKKDGRDKIWWCLVDKVYKVLDGRKSSPKLYEFNTAQEIIDFDWMKGAK